MGASIEGEVTMTTLAEEPAQQEPIYHLKQYGDVTKEQLDRYIATGDINPQTTQQEPVDKLEEKNQ